LPAILCVYVLAEHGSPQVSAACGNPQDGQRNNENG
jgi:hypothetical protein